MYYTAYPSERPYDAEPGLAHFEAHNDVCPSVCCTLQDASWPPNASDISHDASLTGEMPTLIPDLTLHSQQPQRLDFQPTASHSGNFTPNVELSVFGTPWAPVVQTTPAATANAAWNADTYGFTDYKTPTLQSSNSTPYSESPIPGTRYANPRTSVPSATNMTRSPEQDWQSESQTAFACFAPQVEHRVSNAGSQMTSAMEMARCWISEDRLCAEPQEEIDDALTSSDVYFTQLGSPLTVSSHQYSLLQHGVPAYQTQFMAPSTPTKKPRAPRRNRSDNYPYPSPSYHQHHPSIQECQWLNEHGLKCGAYISPLNCPAHLAEHGIKNMSSKDLVQCQWDSCQLTVKRESIVRHVRERHLHVRRASGSTVESSPCLSSRSGMGSGMMNTLAWNPLNPRNFG